MRFVETAVFTRRIRALQSALVLRPGCGAVIPGGGGLRKIRWGAGPRGKRGGIRVLYFWRAEDRTFYMLFAYPKSERDDLTAGQLRALRRVIEEELE